jgi:hypothetical protein
VLKLLSRAFRALTSRRAPAGEDPRPGEIPLICPRCRWLLSYNNPVWAREEWCLFCPVCHWERPYRKWKREREKKQ